MSIEIKLNIKKTDKKFLSLIKELPFFTKYEPELSDDSKSLIFDVYEITLIETIYGDKYDLSKDDREFLKQYENETVYSPNQFKYKNIIGDVNLNFIKFIKHCAIKSNANIGVMYMHERGDSLYELAGWFFFYLPSNNNLVEQFYVEEYDGTAEVQNSAFISKMKNGAEFLEDFEK